MRFRVLDIETIPDFSVWTPGEDQYKLVPSFLAPGPITNQFQACALKIEPFPPPHACRVVAISTVDIVMDFEKSPRYRFDSAVTTCNWSSDPPFDRAAEKSLLGDLSARMVGEEVTLVTWNGRTFDLPVLSMRSFRLGVPFDWYYKDRNLRYRYSDEGHLDLMDYLGDYGASRNAKLGDVARLIGLPGKVGEVSGAGVHDIYKSTLEETDFDVVYKKQQSVARYCLQDTIQTALIFLRSRFHLGKIDRDEYNRCLDTFVQSPIVNETIVIEWGNLSL
jgi:Predicted 3'-5' exonuclease related to the exonuclease domain of PolB